MLDGDGKLGRAFDIRGARGVEVNGFTIRHYRCAGIAVREGRFNRLVHNQILRVTAGEGIVVSGEGNLIWDNDVSRASGDGILIVDSDGNWVVENRSYDKRGPGHFDTRR